MITSSIVLPLEPEDLTQDQYVLIHLDEFQLAVSFKPLHSSSLYLLLKL